MVASTVLLHALMKCAARTAVRACASAGQAGDAAAPVTITMDRLGFPIGTAINPAELGNEQYT